ncbi:uncharacterized protein PV06_10647 [Exophiala oligosperma]|uniref:Aminotransferase class I/classII large domain-containing protein n=1 Tax=Exophiala oligosperma TaxID=215243 RepID=A0A0D2DMT6_9EURO|nr:uncharacterized protein PV06_10647 [Exophiala oligosperma]KIW37014.1 hypothetical protein PV06_10647 [Exophiala oligosperma]
MSFTVTSTMAEIPMLEYDLSIAENRTIEDEATGIISNFLRQKLQPSHLLYNKHIQGDPALLCAVSRLFNDHFDPCQEVQPSHIALSPGASSCLTTLVGALCSKNDGVLIPTPYWNGFDFHIERQAQVRAVPVIFDNFVDSFNSTAIVRALEKAMDEAACPVRAVVITNPHNPLGRCYSADNLLSIAEFCGRRGLHLISDEVYALSGFDRDSGFVSVLSLELDQVKCATSQVHVLWTMSKDFGCSGVRMAALVSQDNPELLQTVSLTGCLQISNLATLAALAILTSPHISGLIMTSRLELSVCYHMIIDFLERRGLDYIPATTGLYVFTRLLPTGYDRVSESQLSEILKASGILVGTGQQYHAPNAARGWFRLVFSLGTGRLRPALVRLGSVLDSVLDNSCST